MVVGFNHNFRYQSEIYHIQTEDGGRRSPNIVTLLYRGGTILASKKTSYADISKVDNLEQVVEELMKEQHKNMLRSLRAGEFDEVIARFEAGRKIVTPVEPDAATELPVESTVAAPAEVPVPGPQTPPDPQPKPATREQQPTDAKPAEPPKTQKPTGAETSLDEIILSYLMGEDK